MWRGYEYCRLDGQTPHEEREVRKKKFRVQLIHIFHHSVVLNFDFFFKLGALNFSLTPLSLSEIFSLASITLTLHKSSFSRSSKTSLLI